MNHFKLYIESQQREGKTGKTSKVYSPLDQRVIGSVALGNASDAHDALAAADRASGTWARKPAEQRAGYLRELSAILECNSEDLARLLATEQGKILSEARGEVEGAIAYLSYAAQSARRIEGEITTSEHKDERLWIERVPYGVTVALLAWNFPLLLMARKVGNALVTGNTMVVKPPLQTPLTVMRFAQLASDSSLPPGVLNFITGSGAEVGSALVSDKLTRLVSLTGSTDTGRKIFKAAAENITALRLELGGNAPFIVCEDADLDKAVESAIVSRFRNGGQICTCNERMYIHQDVYDDFLAKFLLRVGALRTGSSFDEQVDMGPQVSKTEVEKLEDMAGRASEQGARILYDGGQEEYIEKLLHRYPEGNWFFPMVFEVNDNRNILMQEEIFGPIIPILKVSSFDEALTCANESEYGLSAFLFTNNAKHIMRATRELEFGEIYINRQSGELLNGFHTGHKLSGLGGEDGKHGLEGYLQKKSIYMNWDIG